MKAPHRVRMNLEVTFEYMAENTMQIEREVRHSVQRLGVKAMEDALGISSTHSVLVTRIESRRRKEFEYGKSRSTAKR